MESPLEELKAGTRVNENGKRLVRAGKYTEDYCNATRHSGWNEKGRERMNTLIGIVKDDRAVVPEWDEEYLAAKQAAHGKKEAKRSDVTAGKMVTVDDELGEFSDMEMDGL